MKPLSLLSLLLVLTGCSTDPTKRGPEIWYQTGKTAAQAYQDLNACKAEARKALDPNGTGGFMPLFARPDTDGFTRDCMRGKGYTLVHAGAVTNSMDYPRK